MALCAGKRLSWQPWRLISFDWSARAGSGWQQCVVLLQPAQGTKISVVTKGRGGSVVACDASRMIAASDNFHRLKFIGAFQWLTPWWSMSLEGPCWRCWLLTRELNS
jgi:hypothetical protein